MQPTTATIPPTFNSLPGELNIHALAFLGTVDRVSALRASQECKGYIGMTAKEEQDAIRDSFQNFIAQLTSKLNAKDEASELELLKKIFDSEAVVVIDKETRIQRLKSKIIGILSRTSLGNKTAAELRFVIPSLPPFLHDLYETLEKERTNRPIEMGIDRDFALDN